MENLHIVIMAGGVGSRFWPASREDNPKQFLDILGTGKSLIQMTWDRFAEAIPPERMYISTHEKYTELIATHLPSVVKKNILTEPERRNTAPCLAYAALHIHAENPNATILVLPSDHQIEQEDKFLDAIAAANTFAKANKSIMTLGMKATRPDTGYGYIRLDKENVVEGKYDIYKLKRFTEKPDKETAMDFIKSGDYVWNAGIFLFGAGTIIEAFQELAPEVIEPFMQEAGKIGSPGETEYIRAVYSECPSISIDYAIMEKTPDAWCLPVEIGWSDLGTWNSLFNLLAENKNENVSNPQSQILFYNSERNLVFLPDGKKAIIHGIEDYIVIDKDDVLLIWPREKEQEIKALKKEIAERWELE